MPLLYSNIPLTVPYVPVTNEILDRKKRINYGSVIYLGEFSLVADSMSGSVSGSKFEQEYIKELGERISLFVKLFGHETGGPSKKSVGPGVCVCDTQAIADVHWGLKRNVNTAIWVERSVKWIPFIILFKVRELIYMDESSVNTFSKDVEDDTKWYFCSKSIWKKFDYCCYSCFTDGLEVINNSRSKDKKRDLKARYIPSFRKFKSIPNEYIQREQEKVNESEVVING